MFDKPQLYIEFDKTLFFHTKLINKQEAFTSVSNPIIFNLSYNYTDIVGSGCITPLAVLHTKVLTHKK